MEQPLNGFLEMVASHETAPGGGASAAVAVALVAGLSGMTARLSADHLADATGPAERADRLRLRVAPLAQEHATAYGRVLAAYRNQDDGTPGRHSRNPPGAHPGSVVGRHRRAAGHRRDRHRGRRGCGPPGTGGNPNLRGDAAAAALLAEAGVRAAAVLVEINTMAGETSDDRVERVGQCVVRAASAAGGIAEDDR